MFHHIIKTTMFDSKVKNHTQHTVHIQNVCLNFDSGTFVQNFDSGTIVQNFDSETFVQNCNSETYVQNFDSGMFV